MYSSRLYLLNSRTQPPLQCTTLHTARVTLSLFLDFNLRNVITINICIFGSLHFETRVHFDPYNHFMHGFQPQTFSSLFLLNAYFSSLGMEGDPDLQFLLQGGDLLKVLSLSWKKTRHLKLQEDCKTIWRESKKTFKSSQTCESCTLSPSNHMSHQDS